VSERGEKKKKGDRLRREGIGREKGGGEEQDFFQLRHVEKGGVIIIGEREREVFLSQVGRKKEKITLFDKNSPASGREKRGMVYIGVGKKKRRSCIASLVRKRGKGEKDLLVASCYGRYSLDQKKGGRVRLSFRGKKGGAMAIEGGKKGKKGEERKSQCGSVVCRISGAACG